ncbi:MAG: hypothetical protein KH208_15275 [Desulfovibrio sp.]|uniref:hypothetical protein n=1 Tax=Desulfovibrio sp. TaxID=885 RepID=UPI0025C46AAA|nr:hypothetical protein [Desulfovibrio sp.]MBS6831183.1 hypothetical protein [Desulfovibrio sp.]
MRQASLFDHCAPLASAMPAIKAAMRAVAGAPEGEGRKALPDKINAVASASGVRLTAGNTRAISKDTLDKWLSPSDESHPPSILAVLAFCLATNDSAPLRAMLRSVGLDVMTAEDRKVCEYGRTLIEQKKMRKRLRKLEDEL